ncbi:hypothetical protein [Apilactobacillus timberlakei]|nr:hypothetical protein [Apilactobacillus timberlakei]
MNKEEMIKMTKDFLDIAKNMVLCFALVALFLFLFFFLCLYWFPFYELF